MRVLFVNRSSFLSFKGGDTTQLLMTAQELRKLNVDVTIYEPGNSIDDTQFDLIHFFNITRPATILAILKKSKLPFIYPTTGVGPLVNTANPAIPAQVAPGSDAQQWVAASLLTEFPNIKAAPQVRVVPTLG